MRRGCITRSFLDPQALIDATSKQGAAFVFLAFEHPHRSLQILNSVLKDYVQYPIAFYSEHGSVSTQIRMQQLKDDLELINSPSGPSFERWMLQKINAPVSTKKAHKKTDAQVITSNEAFEKRLKTVQTAQNALVRETDLLQVFQLTEEKVNAFLQDADVRFYGEPIKSLKKQSLLMRVLILATMVTLEQEKKNTLLAKGNLELLTLESANQSGFYLFEGLSSQVSSAFIHAWIKKIELGFSNAQEPLLFRGPLALPASSSTMENIERSTEIILAQQGLKIRYVSSWEHPLSLTPAPLPGYYRFPLARVPVDIPLTFNLYLHLEKPDEAFMYVPEGLKVLAQQIERLTEKEFQFCLIRKDDVAKLDSLFLLKRLEPQV